MLSAILLAAPFAPLTSTGLPLKTAENIDPMAIAPAVGGFPGAMQGVVGTSLEGTATASCASNPACRTGVPSTRVAPSA